ncbi:MAG TPA: Fur family transcriptional regulator [Bacillota bacterium]|jgi:Fur family ferric uptake transcriptional regulator
MDETLIGQVRELMAKRSSRLTPQRLAVLEVLAASHGQHLGADDVHARLRGDHPEIGLATVYRTLDLFEHLGLVHRVDLGAGRGQYELAAAEPRHYHHHLICVQCGRIQEFGDDLLDKLEAEITRKADFTVVDHTLRVYGYCADCRKKG